MSNLLRKGILLFGVILLVACSMPETRIYSLHLPPDSSKPVARKQAMITLRVQSPRYLAQPYVAHRLSPYQLDISRYAKWDSAPDEMVREIFRNALSAQYQDVRASNYVSEGSLVLNINLKRFEQVDASFAELAFDAVLYSAEGKELYRIEEQKRVEIDTKDTAGVAKGLSAALSDAVREVLSGLVSKI